MVACVHMWKFYLKKPRIVLKSGEMWSKVIFGHSKWWLFLERQKSKNKKVTYCYEMGRNGIKSDFRASKIAACKHFVKIIPKNQVEYCPEMGINAMERDIRASIMAAGGHYVKTTFFKVAYWSEMARNAIGSDFCPSDMTTSGHFVKIFHTYKNCILIWNGGKCNLKLFSCLPMAAGGHFVKQHFNKRPLGLTAPMSNNTLSMIQSPMNTQWPWFDLSMPPKVKCYVVNLKNLQYKSRLSSLAKRVWFLANALAPVLRNTQTHFELFWIGLRIRNAFGMQNLKWCSI